MTDHQDDPQVDLRFFDDLTRLGPFESQPCLAVAVSGGRDSLCLLHMVRRWVSARGGSLVAFTVDHQLRSDSRHEAEQVAELCQHWGIEHHILTWEGPKPKHGVQAAAREQRYALLTAACHQAGIVHLCVGHTATDQRETVQMRRQRSGAQPVGLAGMAAASHVHGIRVLRPLLSCSRQAVTRYCQHHDLAWLDDPGNENMQHERVRVRQVLPADTASGLMDAARHKRSDLEQQAAAFLVAIELFPAGWARVPRSLVEPHDMACLLALSWLMRWVRGRPGFAPSASRVGALMAQEDQDFTLAGVRCLWHRKEVLFARESRDMPIVDVSPGQVVLWDQRFLLMAQRSGQVRALGEGVKALLHDVPGGECVVDWPEPVRRVWPALWHDDQVMAVATLPDWAGASSFQASFCPQVALTPPPFL